MEQLLSIVKSLVNLFESNEPLKDDKISAVSNILNTTSFNDTDELNNYNNENDNIINFNEAELVPNVEGENRNFITKELSISSVRITKKWSKDEILKMLAFDNHPSRNNVVYPCYTDINDHTTLRFLVRVNEN